MHDFGNFWCDLGWFRDALQLLGWIEYQNQIRVVLWTSVWYSCNWNALSKTSSLVTGNPHICCALSDNAQLRNASKKVSEDWNDTMRNCWKFTSIPAKPHFVSLTNLQKFAKFLVQMMVAAVRWDGREMEEASTMLQLASWRNIRQYCSWLLYAIFNNIPVGYFAKYSIMLQLASLQNIPQYCSWLLCPIFRNIAVVNLAPYSTRRILCKISNNILFSSFKCAIYLFLDNTNYWEKSNVTYFCEFIKW